MITKRSAEWMRAEGREERNEVDLIASDCGRWRDWNDGATYAFSFVASSLARLLTAGVRSKRAGCVGGCVGGRPGLVIRLRLEI
jgi:hypothetical protein